MLAYLLIFIEMIPKSFISLLYIFLIYNQAEASNSGSVPAKGNNSGSRKNNQAGKKDKKLRKPIQSSATNSSSNTNNRVAVDTIVGKHMTGYQGWFTCENGNAARHWFQKGGNQLVIDMLPDVSEYNPDELCTLSGYEDSNGKPIKVFSSQSPGIVDTHFKWMQQYGIDGVFVQEFITTLKDRPEHRLNVTKNVKNSAEKYGRAWAIMFDASGASKDTLSILQKVMPDFKDLITNSPMYLHEHGKPLVAVWGFGGEAGGKHLHDAKYAIQVVEYLKNQGFSVFGGMVESIWKEKYKKDSTWTKLINSLDVLSPWMVGNQMDSEGLKKKVESEMELLKDTNIIYSPVIYPGFSWGNLKDEKINKIPRNGGEFYDKHASAAIKAGAKTLYTAMFDEVDEGTAILKTIAKQSQLPKSGKFVSLDIDGKDIDSDFYLRKAGEITSRLKAAVAQG